MEEGQRYRGATEGCSAPRTQAENGLCKDTGLCWLCAALAYDPGLNKSFTLKRPPNLALPVLSRCVPVLAELQSETPSSHCLWLYAFLQVTA